MTEVEYARGWLRGTFDGEGSCTFGIYEGHQRFDYEQLPYFKVMCRVQLYNTDPQIIQRTSEYLHLFGIEHTIQSYKRKSLLRWGKKPMWVVRVGKAAGYKRFLDEVGFTNLQKQTVLRVIVAYTNREKYRNPQVRRKLGARKPRQPIQL